MELTYSTLAYADAIHDFGNHAIANKEIILSGLPSTPLDVKPFVSDLETTIRDIFEGRMKQIYTLSVSDPSGVFHFLCKDSTTFGLIGDANGSLPLISILERQSE